MNKFLRFTLALTAALIPITEFSLNSSAIAAKAQWVRVITNKDNSVFYVDQASIKRNGDTRYFWTKLVKSKPYKLSNNKFAYSRINYYSLDCVSLRYRRTSGAELDGKGKVIARYIDEKQSDINFVLPDTNLSYSVNFVCVI